ncbi:MAG: biopolymer transporter ExbD [Candidatus Omnitrophica bacterium]|nr:biopolymer transporter ExbD [Candidatus Omnitrophota bacterium]
MKFKRFYPRRSRAEWLIFGPFLNGLFLLFLCVAAGAFVVSPGRVKVYLPKTSTSDILKDENPIIVITGEDVIYFQNKIISLKELKMRLRQQFHPGSLLLIRFDRRSSMAAVVDVWNVCREVGFEKVNIATTSN